MISDQDIDRAGRFDRRMASRLLKTSLCGIVDAGVHRVHDGVHSNICCCKVCAEQLVKNTQQRAKSRLGTEIAQKMIYELRISTRGNVKNCVRKNTKGREDAKNIAIIEANNTPKCAEIEVKY